MPGTVGKEKTTNLTIASPSGFHQPARLVVITREDVQSQEFSHTRRQKCGVGVFIQIAENLSCKQDQQKYQTQ